MLKVRAVARLRLIFKEGCFCLNTILTTETFQTKNMIKTKDRIEKKKSEGRIGRTNKESRGEYAEANRGCALLIKFG